MEPALIVFLGVVIGSIVMAMFLPIFNLAGAVS
jgi:type II secretory pathway component PulF